MHAQPGWPFGLGCSLEYVLDEDGLTVRTIARNLDAVRHGAHPYLTVGAELVDEATVHAAAGRYDPSDERGIPSEGRPQADTILRPDSARGAG